MHISEHDQDLLQRGAVCCSVVQCVVACCSVLQCVAVCVADDLVHILEHEADCV